MVRIDPKLLYSTYSIVAHDEETGQFGAAVQTHQMSVGRIVMWMLPGVGAMVTQSLVNISFGPIGLSMLKEGVNAQNIVNGLVASDANAQRRQLAVVDTFGGAAAFTGEGCIPEAGHYVGEGYSVQANMMTNNTVIDAMREAYESADGDLAHRMLAALQAAQAEDGDIRGKQSSALRVVSADRSQPEWQSVYDLRVDESASPVEDLTRLVRLRHAQLIDAQGYALLGEGHVDGALDIWAKARTLAPELEEIAFWQAIALADRNPRNDAVDIAAKIFNDALAGDERYDHWLDLIDRMNSIGLIERAGMADEIKRAIRGE